MPKLMALPQRRSIVDLCASSDDDSGGESDSTIDFAVATETAVPQRRAHGRNDDVVDLCDSSDGEDAPAAAHTAPRTAPRTAAAPRTATRPRTVSRTNAPQTPVHAAPEDPWGWLASPTPARARPTTLVRARPTTPADQARPRTLARRADPDGDAAAPTGIPAAHRMLQDENGGNSAPAAARAVRTAPAPAPALQRIIPDDENVDDDTPWYLSDKAAARPPARAPLAASCQETVGGRAGAAATRDAVKSAKAAAKADEKILRDVAKAEAKRLLTNEKLEEKRLRGGFADQEIRVHVIGESRGVAEACKAKGYRVFEQPGGAPPCVWWSRTEVSSNVAVTALAVQVVDASWLVEACDRGDASDFIAAEVMRMSRGAAKFRPRRLLLAYVGLDGAMAAAQRRGASPDAGDRVQKALAALFIDHGVEPCAFDTPAALVTFVAATTAALARAPYAAAGRSELDVAPRSRLAAVEGGGGADAWLRALAVIPGVGDAKARNLAESFPTPADVAQAGIEVLESAFGTQRRERHLARVLLKVFGATDPDTKIADA
ncbi:hypothetical protein M885DRAFT_518717 [Pelagophyceae sp. CCMP2097]|nr:hypothetical protein M885DRAFT_518717 [Pelagophyceae sp. CCMP2097]